MSRILVVDDHAFFRNGLCAALESQGHSIAGSLGDGDEALSELATKPVDLVMLDLRMRGRDGVSVLQAMRAVGNNTPVIVLTAELSDEALVALMRASANGIVFKHCPESRLFDAVDAISKGLRFVDGTLVDKAFALSATQPEYHSTDILNDRELQVSELAAQGKRNREIEVVPPSWTVWRRS